VVASVSILQLQIEFHQGSESIESGKQRCPMNVHRPQVLEKLDAEAAPDALSDDQLALLLIDKQTLSH